MVAVAKIQFLDKVEERKYWNDEMKARVPLRDFDTAITIFKMKIDSKG